MLAVSTRFLDPAGDDATFTRRALDLGASGVVAGPEIPEARFAPFVAAVRAGGAELVALEAVCPHPADLARHAPRSGLLPLCAIDSSEREFALRAHRATLARATDLRVGVVVLPLGEMRVDEPDRVETSFAEQGERGVKRELERRAAIAAGHLDAARRSLDSLLPMAERGGVRLAIPNPSTLWGVPGANELGELLREFEGAPLGFWLDIAGASRLERLGLRSVKGWIDLFADRLAGAWVEDTRIEDGGALSTGLAPGHGAIDFAPLIEAARKKPVIAAISCASDVDPGRLRDGVAALRKSGLA